MAPVASAIAAILLTSVSIFFTTGPATVFAETSPLSVRLDQGLSLVDDPLTVDISGQVSQSLTGAQLSVSFKGPVAVEQVGQGTTDAEAAYEVVRWLGAVPRGAAGDGISVLSSRESGDDQDLPSGDLAATFTLPDDALTEPGAYLVNVEVTLDEEILATGASWIGRVTPRETPLDVSFVLPVYLGIHRDWTGTFFDRVLEEATLPVESGVDTLRGLAPMVNGLPTWSLSLAIEPILLTQLRDMADGYVFGGAEDQVTEVGQNDLVAQSATATISDLAGLAGLGTVEVVASPYTGSDLTLLAAEGWRDGLEAIQMGKEELQSTLGIQMPLVGAYSPDLNTTGASLAYYADASVEYVVVSSDLLGSFKEAVAPGTVALRAENGDNDRVTLVFASAALRGAIHEPWDPNVFNAALAADLATTQRSALVIAPGDIYGLIPTQYLRAIGETLTGQSWIHTQKLRDLISLHAPDSRPFLLEGGDSTPKGYIAERVMEGVREAHTAVSDLASAADTGNTDVGDAVRALYVAESRWWSREGTSPTEATMGLTYADQARSQAEAELSKVTFAGAQAPLISAGSDTVRVSIDNAAEYLITAELRLSGEALSFPDGDSVVIDLPPGRTDLEVEVKNDGGPQKLTGALYVGTTVVDEFTRSLGSVGLWTILPWVIAVVVLLAGVGLYLVLKRRAAKSDGEHD